ncbi:MAG: glycosyltransferase family 4 protein [Hyphomicrobiales bacterium]
MRPMKIAIVATRRMFMSPARATSIDLCIHDFVSFSSVKHTTRIFAMPVEEPFKGLDIEFVEPACGHRAHANKVADAIAAWRADCVVVHQHLPTAGRIAARLKPLPVLYHTHNFEKPPRGLFHRLWRERLYRRLAGIIFVSDNCRDDFRRHWAGVDRPLHVVHNALDFATWHPAEVREKVIFYAGRLAPSKGVREIAGALPPLLAAHPDWRAEFLFTERDAYPDYRDEVLPRLAALGDRASVDFDKTHGHVRERLEHVAIALTPSLHEPFGRAALEAHAGGAALVTSAADGLAHVSGDAALVVPKGDAAALQAAIGRYLDDAALLADYARRGRARAESLFDIRRSAATLDAIYAETVAATGR